MTYKEFDNLTRLFRGLVIQSCTERYATETWRTEAEAVRQRMLAAYAEACNLADGRGPFSAENQADSDAWELARQHCECRDCKGRDNLPCDECGVTEHLETRRTAELQAQAARMRTEADEFRVTEQMLRHIAITAMWLAPYREQADSQPVDWQDDWVIGYGPSLLIYDQRFSFAPFTCDEGASELLTWLVRMMDWRVGLIAHDQHGWVVQASPPSSERNKPQRGATICEAIIKAVLAATGWKEPNHA